MKIIIAPDSFKHTMSAAQVCDLIAEAASAALPEAQIIKLPVADGGEGSIDALLAAANGRKIYHTVQGPLFEAVNVYYGLVGEPGRETAVIELAAICGLTMVAAPDPERTTTFGVGQMIRRVLDDGHTRVTLCIGGSATNDGGIGALAALGAVFIDAKGHAVEPVGGNLANINTIDTRGLDRRLETLTMDIACDVTNPLYGENGAAYVFAPQKGAGFEAVKRLDNGLRHYAQVLQTHTGRDIAHIPGSGAAGGFATGFLAYGHNVRIIPGAEWVLDTVAFDACLQNAALVVTGEGSTDHQTLSGKTVLGVLRRAAKQQIPVVILAGAVDDGVDEALYAEGARAVFACCRRPAPFESIRDECPEWLRRTAMNMFRMLRQ